MASGAGAAGAGAGGEGGGEGAGTFAQELGELVRDDFDSHLTRVDGFDDGSPEAGDLDALGEILGDLEINVGRHQGRTHFA